MKQHHLSHSALLLLAGIIAYANSFTVPFVLDDHYSITHYGTRSIADLLLHGTARPVADLTLALNYHLHGTRVAGYHLVNLFLHLCSTLTLYAVVQSALAALRHNYVNTSSEPESPTPLERLVPLTAALLFVCHPLQTQAVTYIIQRYTTLATCLYLLAVVLFIKARLAALTTGRFPRLITAGIVLAGTLAMGSKQIAATLPVMLLLLEIALFRSRLLTRRFFAVCAVLLLGGFVVTTLFVAPANLLHVIQQATTDTPGSSRTSYFLTQLPVLVSYLRLLLVPVEQSLVHAPPVYSSLLAGPVAVALAFHLSLIGIAIVLFRKSEQNLNCDSPSSSYQRLAAVGIFWFYCAMAVESSIIPIKDAMNEHRLYLPSAGFFLSAAATGALLCQRWRISARTATVVLGLTVCTLGTATLYRNQLWNDPVALWREATAAAPQYWLPAANLANEYTLRNMPQQALPLYVRAIELNPELFFRTKIGLGKTLAQLQLYPFRHTTGEEYVAQGGVLGSGVIANADQPKWDAVISNNMGLAYEYLHDLNSARLAYMSALVANPDYDLAWLNMALLAVRQGDRQQAETARNRLYSLNKAMADELDTILKSTLPN